MNESGLGNKRGGVGNVSIDHVRTRFNTLENEGGSWRQPLRIGRWGGDILNEKRAYFQYTTCAADFDLSYISERWLNKQEDSEALAGGA